MVEVGSSSCFAAPTRIALLAALFAAVSAPGRAEHRPRPVSPGDPRDAVAHEGRCPTFSWAGADGARGYELAVLRLSEGPGEEPALVARVFVPGDARAWTPPLDRCLERGGSYAWSVATAKAEGETSLDWAPSLHFEIAAGASLEELLREWVAGSEIDDGAPAAVAEIVELERALAALRRRLVADAGESNPGSRAVASEAQSGERKVEALARATSEPTALASPAVVDETATLPRRTAAAASAPVQGEASLTVSRQIHLADGSALFKDGSVFVWDDEATGNTGFGRGALARVAGVASYNTAVGRLALHNATEGRTLLESSSNTALGDRALFATTLGSFNTAVGSSALASNQMGRINTAVGATALINNTANGNTAVGWGALFANTTGTYNVAVGPSALRANTAGSTNIAIGVSALTGNVDGRDNVATGHDALRSNTTGDGNVASGRHALGANTTGSRNTASGWLALDSNTTGYDNTAVGVSAMNENQSGFRNTAIGAAALANNTSGSENVALGRLAGRYNTTGSNNVFIAHRGVSGAGDASGTIRIGTETTHTSTFIAGIRARAPSANESTVLIGFDGKLGSPVSSRRFKQDIRDLGAAADRLLRLRPVAFRYRERVAADPDGPLEFGLIAEEVAAVFPDLVVFDEEGQPLSVRYHLLSSLLLAELQRLNDRLAALEAQPPGGAGDRRRPAGLARPRLERYRPFSARADGPYHHSRKVLP